MNEVVVPVGEYPWLEEVHGVDTREARVVILHGCRSCPQRIEVFAHDSRSARPMRVYFPNARPEYTVTVSHLGHVYRGMVRQEALQVFHRYRVMSIARGQGRGGDSFDVAPPGGCGDVPVTLMRGHEIERAYRPAGRPAGRGAL
jgi:hypothetical protein